MARIAFSQRWFYQMITMSYVLTVGLPESPIIVAGFPLAKNGGTNLAAFSMTPIGKGYGNG
jgi:hypothetical protein